MDVDPAAATCFTTIAAGSIGKALSCPGTPVRLTHGDIQWPIDVIIGVGPPDLNIDDHAALPAFLSGKEILVIGSTLGNWAVPVPARGDPRSAASPSVGSGPCGASFGGVPTSGEADICDFQQRVVVQGGDRRSSSSCDPCCPVDERNDPIIVDSGSAGSTDDGNVGGDVRHLRVRGRPSDTAPRHQSAGWRRDLTEDGDVESLPGPPKRIRGPPFALPPLELWNESHFVRVHDFSPGDEIQLGRASH